MDLRKASLRDLQSRLVILNREYALLKTRKDYHAADKLHREITWIEHRIEFKKNPVVSEHRPLVPSKIKMVDHVSTETMVKFEPSDYTLGL